MNGAERGELLDLARRAVKAAASGRPLPEPPDSGAAAGPGGAFVTLKRRGCLRGCIGHFEGTGTLGRTVVDMASAAAVRDPRFPPVRPDEVDSLDISISVLSPMVPASPEDVVPGEHGLYVRMGPLSGTLLPQVAEEEGWDRETFLAHTCMKAGLPPDAWRKPDVSLYTYTAEVFGDGDRKGE